MRFCIVNNGLLGCPFWINPRYSSSSGAKHYCIGSHSPPFYLICDVLHSGVARFQHMGGGAHWHLQVNIGLLEEKVIKEFLPHSHTCIRSTDTYLVRNFFMVCTNPAIGHGQNRGPDPHGYANGSSEDHCCRLYPFLLIVICKQTIVLTIETCWAISFSVSALLHWKIIEM